MPSGKMSEVISESNLLHVIRGEQLSRAYSSIKKELGNDFESEFYSALEQLAINKALWAIQKKHNLKVF